jgi:hypothetical protein
LLSATTDKDLSVVIVAEIAASLVEDCSVPAPSPDSVPEENPEVCSVFESAGDPLEESSPQAVAEIKNPAMQAALKNLIVFLLQSIISSRLFSLI